uniref:Uncharacterized protein n=1 Tax=Caenorhabditis japonica TaxID=281687 RepID=A0A8R1DR53_CAEJA
MRKKVRTFQQIVLFINTTSYSIFRDCLIFQFNHFNVTLIFDYVVILMMILILFSVLCLFFGVASDTSCLILPHIVVQAFFLLFSIGYFVLYAFSYFYGDLVVHHREFMLQSMFERMWLATLLLVLAALQSYLFSSVIRCSLYLAEIEETRRRRESAFERCSERVRIAKENGLWRTTSWGGGFQQYKGQYDRPKKEVKNKGFHVQWNTDLEAGKLDKSSKKPEVVELARIESVETPPLSPIPENEVKEPSPSKIVTTYVHKSAPRSEERRGSNTSNSSHRINRGVSESPKKDYRPRSVKKTASEGTSRIEEDLRRMPSVKEHHHREHLHRADSKDSPSLSKRHVKLKQSSGQSSRESQQLPTRRPSLKKNRSVDSGDQYDEVAVFYKEKHHRRRSSDHGHMAQNRRSNMSRSPEKREIPIVKKVSITASTSPFPLIT